MKGAGMVNFGGKLKNTIGKWTDDQTNLTFPNKNQHK